MQSIEPASGPSTVLVVDDEPKNRKLLGILLESAGYRVSLAGSGEEALASVTRIPPDLILLDVMMPGLDGFSVARILKANPATTGIPIIMVTARSDRDARVQGLGCGVEDFLTKPVDRAELMLRVRNLLHLKALSDFHQAHSSELQVELRASEVFAQATIDSVSAHVCVLDRNGKIVAVNQAWREFCRQNHPEPGHCPAFLGSNYLGTCEAVLEPDAPWAKAMAAGIRQVMDGEIEEFNLEYPCDSPTEKRWFLARVTRFRDASHNVVIAHENISKRKQAESALRNASDRLALATQSAQIGIWDWDVTDNTLAWDAQMLRLYGLDEGDFDEVYEAWLEALHPDDRERVRFEITDAVAGNREYSTQFRIIRPDGQLRDIEASGLVQRAADGSALHMIGANRDISDQVQADRRLRYLNRVYAMTSSVNALIVHAVSRDELFQQACRAAVEAGGFQLAMLGVVAPDGLDFIAIAGSTEDAVDVMRLLLAAGDGTPSPMVARALKDGTPCVSNEAQTDPQVAHPEMHSQLGIQSLAIVPLLMAGAPVGVMALYAAEGDFFGPAKIAVLTDLAGNLALAADHLDKRDRLAFLALYDALTGLANRTLFLERVGSHARSAASAGGQLAVLLFDLERFKNINDSLGRAAGDDLLRQVAAWLTGHLGDANLLARLDADHFGIVLPAGGGGVEFAYVIDRMMDSFLRQSFEVNGEALRIAARVGIALYPADGERAETLIEHAEVALKKANARGARYLFYTQKMTDAVAGRLALESQLRNALENDEFVLHYQPKVSLRTGLLTGAEALIRWNHPRDGLMPPGVFIPILEETGMISEVGRWAVQEAISDWLRWRRDGLPAVRIAVNVSPLQLRDPAFISQLEQAIAVAEDAAQGLELEITESMIMDDVDQSISSLQAIRALGICVAIDDFGTGFSSLGYLAKLPIDTLKIDRMFIIGMLESDEGLSLVSTMMTLAHSLRLKVVAEGVETAEQASELGLLKCDEIQGYLVSPALACADFEARFLATGWRMP